jgi:hypothetical protein
MSKPRVQAVGDVVPEILGALYSIVYWLRDEFVAQTALSKVSRARVFSLSLQHSP